MQQCLPLYECHYYEILFGLPGHACVHPPARTLKNITGLVVKVQTKITVVGSQSWWDVYWYKARRYFPFSSSCFPQLLSHFCNISALDQASHHKG